ncbi:hypothetical protein, partial [Burkholderia anthina]|uniref:hypothetical protein n=1 Tax=Burkholderia anthina TaxID=179879 RepID=UPI001E361A58
VRLAQDGDHLFFGKPTLLHDFPFSVGSHSLKFQLVRKFQGRSDAHSATFVERIIDSRDIDYMTSYRNS